MQIKYKEWLCDVRFDKYPNGRTAILLTDTEDGLLVTKATVNIPEVELKPGEVIIKTWSENDGILECLIDAGIISKPKRLHPIGYTTSTICDLLIKL